MNSAMETLINFVEKKLKKEKVFIHMNTWIAGKDLMKYHYLKKEIFKVI